jgi:hypothetical protein
MGLLPTSSLINFPILRSSVEDPDPSDPYFFGPPGSETFYHQAKIIRKTLIPPVLRLLFDFLSLKNEVTKINKQINFFKLVFCWRLEGQ